MKVTAELYLLHQIAHPEQTLPADRVQAIRDLQRQIDALPKPEKTPEEKEAEAVEKARHDKVDKFLLNLKELDQAEFDRVRRLPFQEQEELADEKPRR